MQRMSQITLTGSVVAKEKCVFNDKAPAIVMSEFIFLAILIFKNCLISKKSPLQVCIVSKLPCPVFSTRMLRGYVALLTILKYVTNMVTQKVECKH